MTQARTSYADGALASCLSALPTFARDKREHLRRVAQRADAMRDGLDEQTQRVREARDHALTQLSHLDRRHHPEATFEYKDNPENGTRARVPADFPERKAIVDRIEAAKAELLRLQEEHAAAVPGFNLGDLDERLAAQPNSAKFVDARVSPKVAKGETLAEALLRNRDAQTRMADELARIRNAPRTINEAKALMRQQVAALAEQGRPDVANLFHGRDVGWPTEQFSAGGYGAHEFVVASTITNALALVAWVNGAAITNALDAEIERMADGKGSLSAADQALRIAECEAALLRLQREAEALIERLEGDGVMVRRTCADPVVLLGIERVGQ